MQIKEDISLKHFNSFGIDIKAAFFTEVFSVAELDEALSWANKRNISTFILGGGSNVLFTNDFHGLVIKNAIRGIEKMKETDDHVFLKVGGGVVWHEFVLHCLQQNLAGIENLALIPGLVGASPMQNIGAYGVEIKEVFHELNALHRYQLETETFSNADCKFGYRESVFKNEYKDQFVVTHVTYRLNKTPTFHIAYGAIQKELEQNHVQQLTIRAVADAVITIRSSKLPDPKNIGNAGSFFKNPSVPAPVFERLKAQFPEIVAYPNEDGTMKLAAGWMIEQCGFKGFRKGDAGVHEKQALVLVNFGNAKGSEIVDLSMQVRAAVLEKFGVTIHPEVNII